MQNWEIEMHRLLEIFEQESRSSLRKINGYLMASGKPFGEHFCKYFLKMSNLRYIASIHSNFFKIIFTFKLKPKSKCIFVRLRLGWPRASTLFCSNMKIGCKLHQASHTASQVHQYQQAMVVKFQTTRTLRITVSVSHLDLALLWFHCIFLCFVINFVSRKPCKFVKCNGRWKFLGFAD